MLEDVSEVWFSFDSVRRALSWITSNEMITKDKRYCLLLSLQARFCGSRSYSFIRDSQSIRILDLGCGNAAILLELAKRGYTNLTGVDYSAGAIELAERLSVKNQANIHLLVCHIFNISLTRDLVLVF